MVYVLYVRKMSKQKSKFKFVEDLNSVKPHTFLAKLAETRLRNIMIGCFKIDLNDLLTKLNELHANKLTLE